jgi:hypothetical protein
MSNATRRSFVRWIHIIGYINSRFDQIPNQVPTTRFVFAMVRMTAFPKLFSGQVKPADYNKTW